MAHEYRPIVKLMGVVNATPDSFSDGGRYLDSGLAIAHGRRLITQGADILDIGGESTRPGAAAVTLEEELRRVIPVISGLASDTDLPISIDTQKPAVARAAMAAGASLWNDVSALRGGVEAADTAAELGCEVVLMHMAGDPATMQIAPVYSDVVAEVSAFLVARADIAMAAGVARDRIWFDPGIGFGKTLEHNLALLAGLEEIVALGFPVILGASRKSFIGRLNPEISRLGGSVAAALAGAAAGVAAVRVHDVGQTAQALAVWQAISRAR